MTKLCPSAPQSWRAVTGLTKSMLKQILLLAVLSSASLAQQDADTIIQRSVAANERDWKAAHDYDYVERDRQKGGGTKTSEELMILGSPYERLVAVNGKPLPPEQQAQVQKELETTLEERQKESRQQRRERIAKYEKERESDHLLMEQLTKALDFKLGGNKNWGRMRFMCSRRHLVPAMSLPTSSPRC